LLFSPGAKSLVMQISVLLIASRPISRGCERTWFVSVLFIVAGLPTENGAIFCQMRRKRILREKQSKARINGDSFAKIQRNFVECFELL
jgi:hypothetical protein